MKLTATYPLPPSGAHIPRYRYFFNGQEADNEVLGEGVSLGYEFRQYDARIGRWWSVDPMADKCPGVSPYVFCGGNPIVYVDYRGRDIVPSNSFIASTYYAIFQKMMTNEVYVQLAAPFSENNNTLNYHLDYNTNPFTTNAGRNGINNSTLIRRNGVVISGNIFSEYGRPEGRELSEIAKVQTLLHEIVHANNNLENIKTPNHDGFDRETVLRGLIEYNKTNELWYSNDDLETLSWCGLTESKEFKEFINRRSNKNNRSYDEEMHAFKVRLNTLLIDQAPNISKED
jgi:RHS repeat-associated protein